ncbi:MAG TPA: hypothetical protein PL009_02760 [Flavipsychrobacter sp.]|jgi:hypothetical protein|nr:hypothetical protein [Flavipsychrobacter sp.]HRQ49177.1 hypothetical protein [Agriterribacter sp.]
MTSTDHYPDFEYTAGQLVKFLAASEFFTIMLKNGDIVHFFPKDVASFLKWLEKNNITNMRSEKGWVIDKDT